MPNYVRNRISFEGDQNEIGRMLDSIQMEEHGIGSIDFNKILPMPESLNLEAGSRTDEGLRMYRGYLQAQKQNQPIGKYLRYQSEHPDSWELGKQAYQNILQYGAPTWFEWCTENWGTKWPAIQDETPVVGNELCFDTAWSFPHGIIQKLSSMYPEIVIVAEWADEDIGNNCGRAVFRNGKLIDGYIPTDQKESVEFAAAVWDASPSDWNLHLSADKSRYEYREHSPHSDRSGEAR